MTGAAADRPSLVPLTVQFVPNDAPGISPADWEARAKRTADALAEDEFPPDEFPVVLRELFLRDGAGSSWCYDGSGWWSWNGTSWVLGTPEGILQLQPFTMETMIERPAPAGEEPAPVAVAPAYVVAAPAPVGEAPAPASLPADGAAWPGAARYTATHVVPATGLPAWSRPDPARQPEHALNAGLDVMVTEQRPDGWAHIVCSNEWQAWVDGRLLVAIHD